MGKCQSVGEYKKISLRKNPSPGGKVAPVGGRKRNAGEAPKVSTMQRPPPGRTLVEVFVQLTDHVTCPGSG